jgi:hypothetical protein
MQEWGVMGEGRTSNMVDHTPQARTARPTRATKGRVSHVTGCDASRSLHYLIFGQVRLWFDSANGKLVTNVINTQPAVIKTASRIVVVMK